MRVMVSTFGNPPMIVADLSGRPPQLANQIVDYPIGTAYTECGSDGRH